MTTASVDVLSDGEIAAATRIATLRGETVTLRYLATIAQRDRELDALRCASASAWLPIESAPRDGTRIIYLDKVGGPRGAAMKNPWWVGDCVWRDEDEGVSEGWWDDASTVMAEPLYWMPFVLPGPTT